MIKSLTEDTGEEAVWGLRWRVEKMIQQFLRGQAWEF